MSSHSEKLPFGFVTIATGDGIYLDMAVDLALSLRVLHEDPIVLLTDHAGSRRAKREFPDIFTRVVVLPREAGKGFEPKCCVANHAPLDYGVFIDADCIAVGPMTDARADALAGGMTMIAELRPIGAEGVKRHNRADILHLGKVLGQSQFLRNHGAVYAFERGAALPVMRDAHAMYRQLAKMDRRFVPFATDEVAYGLIGIRHDIRSFISPGPVHWSSDLASLDGCKWRKPLVHFHAQVSQLQFEALMRGVVARRQARNLATKSAVLAWALKRARSRRGRQEGTSPIVLSLAHKYQRLRSGIAA